MSTTVIDISWWKLFHAMGRINHGSTVIVILLLPTKLNGGGCLIDEDADDVMHGMSQCNSVNPPTYVQMCS